MSQGEKTDGIGWNWRERDRPRSEGPTLFTTYTRPPDMSSGREGRTSLLRTLTGQPPRPGMRRTDIIRRMGSNDNCSFALTTPCRGPPTRGPSPVGRPIRDCEVKQGHTVFDPITRPPKGPTAIPVV